MKAPTRRALLAAAVGALSAVSAQAIGRPLSTRAANGDTVKVGGSFSGTSPTVITNSAGDAIQAINSSTGASGLFGYASGSSGTTYGVFGRANSGLGTGVAGVNYRTSGDTRGVYGRTDSPQGYAVFGENGAEGGGGVRGEAPLGTGVTGFGKPGIWGQAANVTTTGVLGRNLGSTDSGSGVEGSSASPLGRGMIGRAVNYGVGVMGVSEMPGFPTTATPTKTGVYGRATQDAQARGVHGYSTDGRGVFGQATSGTGVYASATTGNALRVDGRASFSRSGKLTIAANNVSAVKTGLTLTSSSLVIAVLQQNRTGVFVRAAVPNVAAGSFTVYLNKVASTTVGTTVAWFIVN
jgi:hypothetical protein